MQTPPFAWRREEFVLVSELKHRHSNGLQSIASAMTGCGREPTLTRIRARLVDLEERVFAHASLNKLLSVAPRPEQLELHCLALCFNLVRMFGREDVTPHVHMDDVDLSAIQAFWTSLLVAELVTNALKHSFPEKQGGTIWTDMRRVREHEVELTVSDSRKMSSDNRVMREPRIANALVQKLSGRIDVVRDEGYITRVRFPLETKRRDDAKAILDIAAVLDD
jgi:two-component sensor histidine kinase